MIKFRLAELVLAREREEGRRITWREISDATKISQQTLANLASRTQVTVTNTANVEALCRYFRCQPNDLVTFDPPLEETTSCDIDQLYPDRRRRRTE